MNHNTSFHTLAPKAELLKECISYYYFHKSSGSSAGFSFSFYPHYENALTINRNAKTEIVSPYHVRSVGGYEGYWCNYSQLFKFAARAELQSPFDRIGVVFKPLGLNHFLKQDLAELMDGAFVLGLDWFEDAFNGKMDRIFENNDLEQKVEVLDKIFMELYVGFEEERLQKAVQLIMEHKGKLQVEELSDRLDINRKTLLRLFKKHLNCSVKDYLSMVRFRHALNLYQNSQEKPTLGQLTYEADFNDQSEFIHHFKKVTGLNPRRFFKHLKRIGKQSTYWEINEE